MSLRRVAFALGAATALGGCGVAGAPTPEAALLAPTERLRLYALGRAVEATGAPALATLLEADLARQGFSSPEDGGRVIARAVAVSPVVGWDSNLNGGLPNAELQLPGVTLVATPRSRARGGLAAGGRLGGEMRVRAAEGTFIEAHGDIEAVYAPGEDLHRVTAAGSLCARTHLGGWRFADLCQNAVAIDRDLGRSETHETALGVATLFEGFGAIHEVGLTLARRALDGGDQAVATATFGAIRGAGAGRLAVTLGAPVSDTLAQRWRLAADMRAAPFGQPAILRLAIEESDGERLFGVERRDSTTGATITLPLGGGASLDVGVARTRSTIGFFDETRFAVGLRLAPLF